MTKGEASEHKHRLGNHEAMEVTFRPIGEEWPREETNPRLPSPYQVGWGETLRLLQRELARLGAKHIVVQLALRESRIRADGWPHVGARPTDPRVIVGFQHPEQGWVSYPADLFDDWEGNMRAIALTLQDLRRAGGRGVLRGEQYVGSVLELEAGIEGKDNFGYPVSPPRDEQAANFTTRAEAARFIAMLSGVAVIETDSGHDIAYAYRRAAKKLHPDAGGDLEGFKRLQEAWSVLTRGE